MAKSAVSQAVTAAKKITPTPPPPSNIDGLAKAIQAYRDAQNPAPAPAPAPTPAPTPTPAPVYHAPAPKKPPVVVAPPPLKTNPVILPNENTGTIPDKGGMGIPGIPIPNGYPTNPYGDEWGHHTPTNGNTGIGGGLPGVPLPGNGVPNNPYGDEWGHSTPGNGGINPNGGLPSQLPYPFPKRRRFPGYPGGIHTLPYFPNTGGAADQINPDGSGGIAGNLHNGQTQIPSTGGYDGSGINPSAGTGMMHTMPYFPNGGMNDRYQMYQNALKRSRGY